MNTEKLQKLQTQVIDWANERGIYEKSDAYTQLLKTGEEILELLGAIHRNDLEEIKDALGDIQVCLINYLHFKEKGYEIEGLFEGAEINTRLEPNHLLGILATLQEHEKNEMLFPRNIIWQFLGLLKKTANQQKIDLIDCLESAYNVIKNRKGKMINGQFVKEK
ncbi:hypothetical protein [Ornithobacterium rhinotracheale]|uniref:hypothetical protein n=1 Tax=Ornithobacterium rhinotracheale TaxID=28251 RepID=UPI0040360997